MSEDATHPIAHFLGRLALMLLLAWNGHAASSRLARQPKKMHTRTRSTAVSRIMVEAHLLIFVPLAATLLARGIGMQ